jgi:DNA repair protein RadC
MGVHEETLERDELRLRARRNGLDELAIAELFQLVAGPPIVGPDGDDFLLRLAEMPLLSLQRELGTSQGAATRLWSAFGLAKRVERARRSARGCMNSAEAIWRYMRVEARGVGRECFWALLLDGKHRLIKLDLVSMGTLTTSLVHPREVFRAAVREGAAALVVAHNHPSGDPEPSGEDFDVTKRLLSAANLMGIPLLDHVVLGEHSWVSLRTRMPFG